MAIRFVNDSVKIYLAQKGVPSVFGRDVDVRERLTGAEAMAWFDRERGQAFQGSEDRRFRAAGQSR